MEKHLENKLRLAVKALGGWAIKFNSMNTKGVPDRIILLPGGRIYFVETKWGKNGLSPQQQLIHKILRKFSFQVFVIANNEELQNFLNEIRTS